jgi:hypothetical protein
VKPSSDQAASRPLRTAPSVSEVVETVYCEQKFAFDQQFGRARTPHTVVRAQEGVDVHKAFESQGRAHMARQTATDRRCFIATCVYGTDAHPTEQLRHWRDTHLRPTWWGRALVEAYYAMSPSVVRIMERWPPLRAIARRLLDALLGYMKSEEGGR